MSRSSSWKVEEKAARERRQEAGRRQAMACRESQATDNSGELVILAVDDDLLCQVTAKKIIGMASRRETGNQLADFFFFFSLKSFVIFEYSCSIFLSLHFIDPYFVFRFFCFCLFAFVVMAVIMFLCLIFILLLWLFLFWVTVVRVLRSFGLFFYYIFLCNKQSFYFSIHVYLYSL